MALVKNMTNDYNGLKFNYHRIISIIRGEEKSVEITIRAYTSKEYRDKEKEMDNLKTLWESRREEIENIAKKAEEERTSEEQTLLEEGIEVLHLINSEQNHFLFDSMLALNEEYLENDFSIDKCYQVLKTIEPYIGAEDA